MSTPILASACSHSRGICVAEEPGSLSGGEDDNGGIKYNKSQVEAYNKLPRAESSGHDNHTNKKSSALTSTLYQRAVSDCTTFSGSPAPEEAQGCWRDVELEGFFGPMEDVEDGPPPYISVFETDPRSTDLLTKEIKQQPQSGCKSLRLGQPRAGVDHYILDAGRRVLSNAEPGQFAELTATNSCTSMAKSITLDHFSNVTAVGEGGNYMSGISPGIHQRPGSPSAGSEWFDGGDDEGYTESGFQLFSPKEYDPPNSLDGTQEGLFLDIQSNNLKDLQFKYFDNWYHSRSTRSGKRPVHFASSTSTSEQLLGSILSTDAAGSLSTLSNHGLRRKATIGWAPRPMSAPTSPLQRGPAHRSSSGKLLGTEIVGHRRRRAESFHH